MKIVNQAVEFIDKIDGEAVLAKIERCGRVCYKSEDRITPGSARKFVEAIIKSGHESVIEHVSVTVLFITNRGVSHEIVRHRIASYSQESTRYVGYHKGKFGSELTVTKPPFFEERTEEYKVWKESMIRAEEYYMDLISKGANPEEARDVLPNSLKTEIVITMNLREWRHFFNLRTSEKAHPEMREIARLALYEFKEKIPVIFDDI